VPLALPPYRDLGGFPFTPITDPTGRHPFYPNTGATVQVNADDTFKTAIALAELYHMYIGGASSVPFQIWRNQLQWDYVLVGANAWDPSQPLPLRSGDTIWIYFDTTNLTLVTTVVAWLREPLAYAS